MNLQELWLPFIGAYVNTLCWIQIICWNESAVREELQESVLLRDFGHCPIVLWDRADSRPIPSSLKMDVSQNKAVVGGYMIRLVRIVVLVKFYCFVTWINSERGISLMIIRNPRRPFFLRFRLVWTQHLCSTLCLTSSRSQNWEGRWASLNSGSWSRFLNRESMEVTYALKVLESFYVI